MMFSRIFRVIGLAGALLLAACFPESKNPLSSPAASDIDEHLSGVFAQRDKTGKEDPAYWHFHYHRTASSAPGKFRDTPLLEVMSVSHTRDGGLKTNRYLALATHLGGHHYLSFIDFSGTRTDGQPRTYGFARYEVNWRGEIRIWLANNNAFAQAIKTGKLRGNVKTRKTGDDVELTDTTAHLAAFVAAGDPEKLFGGNPMVLKHLAP